MGFVPAFLAVEVRAIAVARAVLRPEALVRHPRLDQRAVHREVLVRQQRLHLRVVQKSGHERLEHIALLQPLPVLGERCRVPHRIVRRKPHEPSVEKIVVEMFHQLTLRAQAVEDLEQQRAQQALRRDRWTAFPDIQHREASAHLLQHSAHQGAHLPQGMLLRNPFLRRNIGKQPALILKPSAH